MYGVCFGNCIAQRGRRYYRECLNTCSHAAHEPFPFGPCYGACTIEEGRRYYDTCQDRCGVPPVRLGVVKKRTRREIENEIDIMSDLYKSELDIERERNNFLKSFVAYRLTGEVSFFAYFYEAINYFSQNFFKWFGNFSFFLKWNR